MTSQLHLAREIAAGRIHHEQDPAQMRSIQLAREDERKARRRS